MNVFIVPLAAATGPATVKEVTAVPVTVVGEMEFPM